jgi:hypothetical protein
MENDTPKPTLASVYELTADARFSPTACAQRLAEDLASGELRARRLIIVVEPEDIEITGEIHVRAAGPGMDYTPTAVGLLMIAAREL